MNVSIALLDNDDEFWNTTLRTPTKQVLSTVLLFNMRCRPHEDHGLLYSCQIIWIRTRLDECVKYIAFNIDTLEIN